MSDKPTLGYWKIRGLAQPIRLLLAYQGIQYEDKQYEQGDKPDYSRDKWLEVKPTLGLPIPNLPYYIDGDIKITQSNAIIRYIARKGDLLGKTEEEKVKVDVMLEQAMDFRNAIVGLCYNPAFDSKKADFFKGLPAKLQVFNDILGKQDFFAGKNVTAVDFPIYELLDQTRIMQVELNNEKEGLKDFPTLVAFIKRIEALPAIKKYMGGKDYVSRPINNKSAGFK